MRKAELVVAVLLGLLSLFFMWESGKPDPNAWDPALQVRFGNIGWIEGEGPGSGYFPFYLSLGMFLCCVWIVINWVRKTSPLSTSDEIFLDGFGQAVLLKVGAGLIGFLALIGFIGFYGAMLVFLLYYLLYIGRHGWLMSIAISIATPVICFFFFDVAMRIVLPKGYLEPLFLPLYDIFLS